MSNLIKKLVDACGGGFTTACVRRNPKSRYRSVDNDRRLGNQSKVAPAELL